MSFLPDELYQKGFIASSSDMWLQVVPVDKGAEELHVVNKNNLGVANWFRRFVAWLGLSSASIKRVSDYFHSQIAWKNQGELIRQLCANHTKVEIGNLVVNLIHLNEKIDRHNEKRWSAVTSAAAKIDEVFIFALSQKTVDEKPKMVLPPKPVRTKKGKVSAPAVAEPKKSSGLMSLFWGAIGRAAKPEPGAPPPESPPVAPPVRPVALGAPPVIANQGNTCHFDSAVNCLAFLPPIREVFRDSEFERDDADQKILRDNLSPILDNQANGNDTIGHDQFQDLMMASRIRMLKDSDINAQQDAHEDVGHLLHNCDSYIAGGFRVPDPRISTPLLKKKTYLKYRVTTILDLKKPEDVARIDKLSGLRKMEVPLGEDEILNGAPFQFEQLTSAEYFFTLAINGPKGVARTFGEAFEGYFGMHRAEKGRMILKAKDSTKMFIVETEDPFILPKMQYAPEVLMFTYKRWELGGAHKIDDAVITPKNLTLAGKYFVDDQNHEYVLCSCIVQSGDVGGGHYYAVVNRLGEFYKVDDLYPAAEKLTAAESESHLNRGYVYGYVRRDVYEASLKA